MSSSSAAHQLGSMSIGEGNDDAEPEKNEDAEEKGETTPATKLLLCSACGKEGDAHTLKKCTACKCVWYCDKDCQNKHWKEHKKECRRIKEVLDKRGGNLDVGTEKDIWRLPELPPREECPVCMRVLPIHQMLQVYFGCCGKVICCGCDYQHQMQSEKWAAEKGQTSVLPTCAFCKTDVPVSDEEVLARLHKRVGLNDAHALRNMSLEHGYGDLGLPVNQTKCIDLLRESASLGFPGAQYQLGVFYHNGAMGLQQNLEEATQYWERAAEGGHVSSRHNLGCSEWENGCRVAAVPHFRLAASAGFRLSAEALIECFEVGLLHHADLAETAQAFYRARAEIRSEDRDEHIKYLKETGEYKEEYDLCSSVMEGEPGNLGPGDGDDVPVLEGREYSVVNDNDNATTKLAKLAGITEDEASDFVCDSSPVQVKTVMKLIKSGLVDLELWRGCGGNVPKKALHVVVDISLRKKYNFSVFSRSIK